MKCANLCKPKQLEQHYSILVDSEQEDIPEGSETSEGESLLADKEAVFQSIVCSKRSVMSSGGSSRAALCTFS